mgnify:CR=1 FL=1
MAHFAKVVNGIVVDVLVMDPEFLENGFVDTSPGEWIQTSYNTWGGVHYTFDDKTGKRTPSSDQSKALRKNYAAIGYVYDKERDAFYEQKPFDSWTLNEETCLWEPPIPMPEDTNYTYYWDEENKEWKSL